LLQELEALKGNRRELARPGTATAEVAAIRNERDRAMEERNDARNQADQERQKNDQLEIENRNLKNQVQ